MLRPRIIPFLLIHKGGLVKTRKFSEPKYVGDPLNAVRIFNEKEVDEIMVADMDATVNNKEPDMDLIAKLAEECRMPLCYVGGVTKAEQVEKIVSLGVEKVGISGAAVENPSLIAKAAMRVGNQSVVVVLDVKRIGSDYEVFIHNGKRGTGLKPAPFAKEAEELGAGEIVVNSIDRDGTGEGYDEELVGVVRRTVQLPVTALGGAGRVEDLGVLVQKFGSIGAAAGSLFVFKGKYRAVLITYPAADDKKEICVRGRAEGRGGEEQWGRGVKD